MCVQHVIRFSTSGCLRGRYPLHSHWLPKAFQENTPAEGPPPIWEANLSRAMDPHSLQADDPEKKMPRSNRGLNPALKGKVF